MIFKCRYLNFIPIDISSYYRMGKSQNFVEKLLKHFYDSISESILLANNYKKDEGKYYLSTWVQYFHKSRILFVSFQVNNDIEWNME